MNPSSLMMNPDPTRGRSGDSSGRGGWSWGNSSSRSFSTPICTTAGCTRAASCVRDRFSRVRSELGSANSPPSRQNRFSACAGAGANTSQATTAADPATLQRQHAVFVLIGTPQSATKKGHNRRRLAPPPRGDCPHLPRFFGTRNGKGSSAPPSGQGADHDLEPTTGPYEGETPPTGTFRLQENVESFLREKALHFFGTLDDDHTLCVGEDLVPPDAFQLLCHTDAVQIEMIDRVTSLVLMDQGERRAPDPAPPRHAQGLGDSTGEEGLPGAHLSHEAHDISRLEVTPHPGTEPPRLVRRGGDQRGPGPSPMPTRYILPHASL